MRKAADRRAASSGARSDLWLEQRLAGLDGAKSAYGGAKSAYGGAKSAYGGAKSAYGGAMHAPPGFTDRVMKAVYREALSPRQEPAAPREARADGQARRSVVLRLYRRVAISLMLTAAVLAVSLLVPRAAYPTLIGSGEGAALGRGPSNAVRSALTGAAATVQEALGEQSLGVPSIEGGQQ